MRWRRGPPCFCRPGAYLVVKRVVTRYVREYRTMAAQTERGIVWVGSHEPTPPDTLPLPPFRLYLHVWLLFITPDNINSILNKRGNEASFEAFPPSSLSVFFSRWALETSPHPVFNFCTLFIPRSVCITQLSPPSPLPESAAASQTADPSGWHHGSTANWSLFTWALQSPSVCEWKKTEPALTRLFISVREPSPNLNG